MSVVFQRLVSQVAQEPSDHPSRVSEQTKRSVNILGFSVRAGPVEAHKSSFSATDEVAQKNRVLLCRRSLYNGDLTYSARLISLIGTPASCFQPQ